MMTQRYVTLTEYNWIMRRREEEEAKRREEEASLAQNKKGAKKVDKKPTKGEERKDAPPASDPNEDANIPLSDPIAEPESVPIEKTEKNVILRGTATSDFTRYEVENKSIYFKPTLMYTTRTHQLKVRNTSLIALKYNCRIVSAESGVIDPGFFYVNPKAGVVAPNCDEVFTIKFSPTEVLGSNEIPIWISSSLRWMQKQSGPYVTLNSLPINTEKRNPTSTPNTA
jgi:hydrocephalus-inducing protein